MSVAAAGHGHDVGERLYLPGDSLVHRLPAHVKIAAGLTFMVVVVATPARHWWAFAWYAVLIGGVAVTARLPLGRLATRMTVEIPFVVFALLLPFLGRPPMTEVLGLSLSEPGLLAAWNILAKATLGVAASVLLAATTRSRDLLDGLATLRVPALLVEIAGFMVRYLHVVSDEWRRMSMARVSRAPEVDGVRSWPVVSRTAGVLFIRSYERGERVHLAMLARGYGGSMPLLEERTAGARDWLLALALPGAAVLGAGSAALWMAGHG